MHHLQSSGSHHNTLHDLHVPVNNTYPISLQVSHLYLKQREISQNLQIILQDIKSFSLLTFLRLGKYFKCKLHILTFSRNNFKQIKRSS